MESIRKAMNERKLKASGKIGSSGV